LNGAQVVVAFQDAFDRAIWFTEIQGEAFQASKVPLTATEAHGLFTVLSHDGQLAAHFVVDRTKEPWGFVRVESR
jgi:N-acetyl-anhydromuramyl-L-alanine amidase AmpD